MLFRSTGETGDIKTSIPPVEENEGQNDGSAPSEVINNRAKIDKLKSDIAELRKQLEALDSTDENYESEKQRLESQIEDLEQQLSELEGN